MKVSLIIPPKKSLYAVAPLGLGYLATALRKNNFEVEIIDCIKRKLNHSGLKRYIQKVKPQCVGIQFFSCDFDNVNKTAKLIKDIDHCITVLAGGPHPSGIPYETLKAFKELDYGFKGEAEIGLPLLLRRIRGDLDIALQAIPGLIWREDGRVKVNPQSLVEDLDVFDPPSWDLINPEEYGEAPQGGMLSSFPYAPLITSRGCSYHCAFCSVSSISGRKIRYRSINAVLKEIVYLHSNHGIKEFHIIDDAFTVNRNRVIEFCNEVIKRNLGIKFAFPNGVRLDTLDKEILNLMKKTGLYSLNLGIESGSQRILDRMKKGLDLRIVRERVGLINETGLNTGGFFIIGFPKETPEEIRQTIDFAKELPIKRAEFSDFKPLPGTEITAQLLKSGEITSINYNYLISHRVSYAPKGISYRQLKWWQRRAFLEFYLRPGTLIGLLRDIRSLRHLTALIKRCLFYLC